MLRGPRLGRRFAPLSCGETGDTRQASLESLRAGTWSRDNMSLEADEAGGRLSSRKLLSSLPSSSQLNSRSLCGPACRSAALRAELASTAVSDSTWTVIR